MSTTEPVDALEATDAYPKYDEYKDSGVEWLGEIPVHWQTTRVQRVADIHPSSVDKKSEEDETPVKLCNYTDVYYGSRITDESGFMEATATASEIETHELRAGDVLVTKDSEARDDIAVPALVGRDMPGVICGYHLAQLRPSDRIDGAYLYYSLKSPSVSAQFEASATGITRYGLGVHALKKSHLYLPPLDEQRAIATFLDRETERIDALIEKKEELIDLLEEKCTAIISRVVTKGLDRDVEMQDSGVEWLGKIPAHWETANLMHLTPADRKIMYGIILPGPHHEGGVPIIKGGNVKPGELERENLNCTDPEIDAENAKSRVQADDIVYAIRGSIGEAEQVPKELEGANLTQDAARISPKDDIDERWLLHVVRSAPFFAQLEARALGATVKGINIRDLKRASVPAPPLNEQLEIAKYLDAETSRIDALKVRIDDGIDRLKEYRTALISAAVTGQIDVRKEVGMAPVE